jgi:membrane protease subunit HflK
MPWNDNANSGQKPGPWGAPPPSGGSGGGGQKGGGSGGPRGDGSGGGGQGPKRPRRPGGGGGPPPDLNEFGRQMKDQLDRWLGGGKGVQGQTLAIVGAFAVAIWLASGVYMVQPNEEAVVLTFGQYSNVTAPGLHTRWPWPIQSVEKVRVTEAKTTPIGGREGAEELKESLMLTGDENIVDINFAVLWRISDPAKFLFNVDDPTATVKSVGESAMREVVGRTALDPIISNGRAKLQDDTRVLMQRTLDTYNSGILVQEVQVKTASPPPDVADAFRDVTSAKQEAESYANQAGAEAAKIRNGALGYKAQVVNEAQGEAARFNQVYAQYKLAPGVTRQRLYIETMERVLKNTKKVIVDAKGATAPIILPPDAFRPKSADQPQAAQPQPAPAPGAAR